MIATILPSSTTFHAVEYNKRKVAKGQAVLLEMQNFGYVGAVDGYTPEQLQQYLMDYSARNEHIRKAQFHVASALELLEDDLVHLRAGLHQGGGDDGQRAALGDVARSAEELLGRVQGGCIDTTGEDAARGGRSQVVGARQTRE